MPFMPVRQEEKKPGLIEKLGGMIHKVATGLLGVNKGRESPVASFASKIINANQN